MQWLKLAYFVALAVVSASPVTNSTELLSSDATAAAPALAITSITMNGSGCPSGSASFVLAANKQAVTILYNSFAAAVGPGVPVSQNRASCQLSLAIKVPSGQNVALTSVDYRGFYQLDSKVTATQSALYYFQGNLIQSNANGNLVGPVTGADYTYRNSFSFSESNTSPCGASTVMNIQTSLSVSNSANTKGTGLITDDSSDVGLTQTFNLAFGKC